MIKRYIMLSTVLVCKLTNCMDGNSYASPVSRYYYAGRDMGGDMVSDTRSSSSSAKEARKKNTEVHTRDVAVQTDERGKTMLIGLNLPVIARTIFIGSKACLAGCSRHLCGFGCKMWGRAESAQTVSTCDSDSDSKLDMTRGCCGRRRRGKLE